MPKSPEGYVPSPEEVKKAEDMMDSGEKLSSKHREHVTQEQYLGILKDKWALEDKENVIKERMANERMTDEEHLDSYIRETAEQSSDALLTAIPDKAKALVHLPAAWDEFKIRLQAKVWEMEQKEWGERVV